MPKYRVVPGTELPTRDLAAGARRPTPSSRHRRYTVGRAPAVRRGLQSRTKVPARLSRFLSLRRRSHPPPSSPKAKSAAPDREGPKAFGRTCFVPSRAEVGSVISASDMPVASTNLKRDLGNTKDSLRNWVQLSAVNLLLVPCGSDKLPPRRQPHI